MVDASRKVDTVEGADVLKTIAEHLCKLGAVQQACDVLRRLNDTGGLIKALVESQSWTEAIAVVKQNQSHKKDVYLPYARWLAEQEMFVEAQRGE